MVSAAKHLNDQTSWTIPYTGVHNSDVYFSLYDFKVRPYLKVASSSWTAKQRMLLSDLTDVCVALHLR